MPLTATLTTVTTSPMWCLSPRGRANASMVLQKGSIRQGPAEGSSRAARHGLAEGSSRAEAGELERGGPTAWRTCYALLVWKGIREREERAQQGEKGACPAWSERSVPIQLRQAPAQQEDLWCDVGLPRCGKASGSERSVPSKESTAVPYEACMQKERADLSLCRHVTLCFVVATAQRGL